MLTSLSSLRFFGALGIYFHHLKYNLGLGPIVVTFFFILSGFFMAYGYKNKFQTLDFLTYKKFLINRFARLYPIHFLAFLISIYIMYLTGFKTNWVYATMNLFLIQTYTNIGNQVFAFSGVSWFLADCIFLYALTPFLLFFLHKTKIVGSMRKLFLCGIILLSSGFVVAYFFKGNVVSYSPGWWLIYISPYNRIFDYGSGLLCGLIFSLLSERKHIKCNFFLFSLLEIGAILIGYLTYTSSLLPFDSIRFDMFWVPAILLIIFVLAFQNGVLSKILSLKFFIKLGELSFSIFMIHTACITLTALVLGSRIYEAGTKKHFLAQLLLFGAIICVADVINRYYEIPLRNWTKRIFVNNIFLSKNNDKDNHA